MVASTAAPQKALPAEVSNTSGGRAAAGGDRSPSPEPGVVQRGDKKIDQDCAPADLGNLLNVEVEAVQGDTDAQQMPLGDRQAAPETP